MLRQSLSLLVTILCCDLLYDKSINVDGNGSFVCPLDMKRRAELSAW